MPFPPDGKPPTHARLHVGRLGAFRLAYAPAPSRLTQAAVEAHVEHHAPLRLTQVPVEVLVEHEAPLRVTQAAVEVATKIIPPVRLTQAAVEVFLIPPPCYNGAFPVDTV